MTNRAPESDDRPDAAPRELRGLSNRYGHFSADGREFVITDPVLPRPWVNVIASPRMGLVVSHTGSGFSFVDNSQLAVLTRWQQELAADSSGKLLYLRDADSGDVWSASPAPTFQPLAGYRCRHGMGYTTFETSRNGLSIRWTLLVHPTETAELWLVELANAEGTDRRVDLVPFLEWNLGVAPSPRREFTKLFLETAYVPLHRAVVARSHMWEVGSPRWGHWNTSFPYVTALATSAEVTAAEGDKGAFLGRGGTFRAPAALSSAPWPGLFGRHHDAVAALQSRVTVPAGGSVRVGYVLATSATEAETLAMVDRLADPAVIAAALDEVRAGWVTCLAAHRMTTPEPSLDVLVNDWVRYQAIAARLWGRCGYYQQSGAFGFRDQLQDSQVWLTIEPERCRAQIALHAAHQFADGSVHHWWHPLSELGLVTRMTDDLLWLAFVIVSYVKETGDVSILDDWAPFLDDPEPAPLAEHVRRAFQRVFTRMSPRGLPLIGAGDWNDGLSAVGLEEKGESVWLAQFLAGLLADWAVLVRARGDEAGADEALVRHAEFLAAVNRHAWDGAWYWRASRDDGELIGSHTNRVGQIYLNAQVWAILNDVAPPDRAASCWAAVRERLMTRAGALLLAPAYDEPVQEIGYITRYAPGLRENGGVYTHAATWAIAAAAKMGDAEAVADLLEAINPALKDPDSYWAEPYVLPGNVDGPESPLHGRGGWTWYTGSAAWLHRVVTAWVLGVRPEWEGLRVDPCLPPSWPGATMTRPWRGATYRIEIKRDPDLPAGSPGQVTLDGVSVPDGVLPPPTSQGERHEVKVVIPA